MTAALVSLLVAVPLAAQQPADSALRAELVSRLARDQAIRDTLVAELRATQTVPPELATRMRAVDSSNTAWLQGVVARGGWPTRAQVGEDGVQAAFLLVQHADHDPAFQARMLPLLEQAVATGDARPGQFALLSDRVAKAQGRRQRYGTQSTITDGRVVIDPIEDSAHVDERRARMGLPPLAEYVRVLDSVYVSGRP